MYVKLSADSNAIVSLLYHNDYADIYIYFTWFADVTISPQKISTILFRALSQIPNK